ncbi:MAG: hypothetical protein QM804_09910 [Propionicimonas sp.]
MNEPSVIFGVVVLVVVVASFLWYARRSLRIWQVRRKPVKHTHEALDRSFAELRHGDPAEALRMLNLVIANSTDPQALAQAQFMRGVLLSERGRHRLAVESFDQCLSHAAAAGGLTIGAAGWAAVRRSYSYVGRTDAIASWEATAHLQQELP